ncbi:response regulator [candidate division WOR-3 bacterium]|uniref:Response regulator n=1 Tax=candidate division TA06 bacterium TaxID=2250710 RepID=A0A660SB60_UNCT6|nr:response regulator [candidate division WOR-3 bacterium]RKX67979.1 MAG: response regulator [candidate division TA06 bacterium]
MANILIIDDDRFLLDILSFTLKKAGYDILTAMDGNEALQIIENDTPDLVISDIMMPNMDGYTMLEKIRNNPKTISTKVIFLSAKGNPKDIEKGYNLGVNAYITKPFNLQELLEKIENQLKS